ncbi:MAG: RHS repeat-associated core domain-containing protein [Sneathiella sp.]
MPGASHRIILSHDSLDGIMVADAVKFEVIDDLPSVVADAVKLVPNGGESVTYIHSDHLGAPTLMTDASRSVVWDRTQLPFGSEDSLTGSAANGNRFPGQREEAETGLYYNYFRDYDPTTGRYLQSDPIGLNGGINTYGYTGGNPVNYVDPDGLSRMQAAKRRGEALRKLFNHAPRIYEQCKTWIKDWFKKSDNNDGPLLPDEAWSRNAPHQVSPGTPSIKHDKYNPKTGKTETSEVEYDQYGRQTKRTDYTDHGYGDNNAAEYHSDPHTHTYEYGPAYGFKGRGTRKNQ